MALPNQNTPVTENRDFPAVGIVVSGTDFSELEVFFASGAIDGMAYVIHSSDNNRIQKHISFPVKKWQETIESNTVYVSESESAGTFLSNLAVNFQSRMIGVSLGIPGADIQKGFEAIRKYGGLTFVSTNAAAESLDEWTDFISPPHKIPAQLKLLTANQLRMHESEDRFSEQSDEMLRQTHFSDIVFNASVDFMIVYDKDMRFLAYNDACRKLYGFDDSNIGKSLFDLYPETRGSKGHLDVMRAIAGELVHNPVYESPITGLFYEDFMIPLKATDGSIYAALIVGRDITGHIKSEAHLKELNSKLQLQNDIFKHAEENAMIGSYTWNLRTEELQYSDNLFRILGYEPNAFVPTFEKFMTFIHPDDKEEVLANAAKTIETKNLFEDIYRIITPRGQVKHLRSSGNFVENEENYSLIGTVQDVTKDIQQSETLQKQNIELQHNNDDLASFNYIASHDLQEPLRKIQLFSSRILERDGKNFSVESADYFKRIESAIQRMNNLIQALLSYSSTNSADIKLTKTNLNKIVDEVKISLDEAIAEKNAIIHSEVLPSIPVIPLQFHQLLLNLVSNAIKYSQADVAPKIRITAENVAVEDKNQKYWKIAVADNGIGFDQQYQHKIFDLFQRLHGKTDYEGTGVGLAICKKIVQNHNGFITAEGSPGKGSTFAIYIPSKN